MTDLSRLLRPRSVAVVGASERATSYGGEALRNLERLGFPGRVYAVNPKYASVGGVPCFPSLDAVPEAVDAVVVAIPAPAAPAVVEQAGALGCGGAVVFAAGFGEAPGGAALERELADAARRWSLPVCGPNGNGIVSVHERCALWGDAVAPAQPGPVALVSQSGNVAVNALGARRGLRLHTVVSCGNGAVLDAADFTSALASLDGVRSIALYLEDDGDGARWCAALEACARAGVGVAVLKAGSSPAGAAAAQAHTHALAGDQRVVRALFEEAGAAWARDPHELLELAKALATRRPATPGRGRFARRSAGGLAVMTCSGGDSAVAADLAAGLGLELPALAPATVARLRETLPEAATAANPLDYTALLWYDQEALRALILALAEDPAIDRVLVLFDYAMSVGGDVDESWAGVVDAVRAGAATSPVPVALASTLPELLDDGVAARMIDEGMPALAGLAPALRCMQALAAPPPDPERIAQIGAAARGGHGGAGDGWLAEHEAKALLRKRRALRGGRAPGGRPRGRRGGHGRAGRPGRAQAVRPGAAPQERAGRRAAGTGDARGGAGRSGPVAVGRPPCWSSAWSRPAWSWWWRRAGDWCRSWSSAWAACGPRRSTTSRSCRSRPRRSGCSARCSRFAAAPLLTGARGRPAVDVGAAARLAAGAGDLLLDAGLELLELNPVIVHEQGAVAVDALARREGTPEPKDRHMNEIAARLGEVGLPAPVSELAAREWDAVVVGGGHNGLTAAAYLAREGQSVLVLERRERLGGACTLERPFSDERFVISPCAYVVGLLDELVIRELDLRRRGFECYVADPNLWVPFEDGTSFAQWLDPARTQANLEAIGVSKKDIDGYWAYEEIFDVIRRKLRTGERDSWLDETPTRAEIEAMLDHDQTMIDIVFDASIADVLDGYVSDERIRNALFGQAIIAAYGGPKDPGTASIKLMHYQGDLEGQGPVWGYVKGGMGMISFAIADAARDAGAQLACGVPVSEIVPEQGVRLEDGTLIRARTVICNADPKVALDLLDGADDPGRLPRAARGVEGPQPGREVQRRAQRAARVDRGPRRDLARARDDQLHRQPRRGAGRVRAPATAASRPSRFGEVYIQTGYDPSPAPEGHHLLSVFGQYAPYELAQGTWDERRDEVARQFIDLIERFAPGFGSRIEYCEVLGPPDIEKRIGLTGGNIFQGEVTPDQMWENRLAPAHPGARPLLLRRRDPPGRQRDRAQRPERGDGRARRSRASTRGLSAMSPRSRSIVRPRPGSPNETRATFSWCRRRSYSSASSSCACPSISTSIPPKPG